MLSLFFHVIEKCSVCACAGACPCACARVCVCARGNRIIRNKNELVLILYELLFSPQTYFILVYASLPNSRGAWNKRGGRNFQASYIFKRFCLDGQHVYEI